MATKVYIRTFGCQMNEYDSDKMADVLRAERGMEKTDDVNDADVILFNTCSVRDKAQERVFHDLGRVKHLKLARPNLLIGVGGCVASQEGAQIVARAPYRHGAGRQQAIRGSRCHTSCTTKRVNEPLIFEARLMR